MESVAARAKTGVAVLYRRWPNKDDLVLAAIRHYGATHPVEIPDTGSLRGDMIAPARRLQQRAGRLRHHRQRRVLRPAGQHRPHPGPGAREGHGRPPAVVAEIFARAHERGEIDLDSIPPAVLTMPFDLMRHDMLMTSSRSRRSGSSRSWTNCSCPSSPSTAPGRPESWTGSGRQEACRTPHQMTCERPVLGVGNERLSGHPARSTTIRSDKELQLSRTAAVLRAARWRGQSPPAP